MKHETKARVFVGYNRRKTSPGCRKYGRSGECLLVSIEDPDVPWRCNDKADLPIHVCRHMLGQGSGV